MTNRAQILENTSKKNELPFFDFNLQGPLVETPLRYAGGKSKAYHIITHHILSLPKIKRIISPFLGGGSLESKWASAHSIEVIGYDIFYPLINFWQQLLYHPDELYKKLITLSPDKENYYKIKEILICWDKTQEMMAGWHTNYYKRKPIKLDAITAAAYYFYNHNLSYGPMYLGWISKIYQNKNKWLSMAQKIKKYKNPILQAKIGDFEQVIANYNKDCLYLDPPYYLEKDNDNKMFKGIYPNANFDIHHTGFNHEKLRDLLYHHNGPFVLSYNNCETIRKYYADFDMYFPEWHYSYALGETRIGKNKIKKGNTPKESHEILIVKM
ncbi:MAG: DNA adenine methylase [Alphaproteobacteria bacterium]